MADSLYYLSSGNFISTKRELLECVQDEDKAVLELSVSLQNIVTMILIEPFPYCLVGVGMRYQEYN